MNKFVIAVLVLLVVSVPVYQKVRGLRNNNPGNIRYSPVNDWVGQIGQDDGGFVIFDTSSNGIRAMAINLGSYQKRGVLTVDQIISTWAPSSEKRYRILHKQRIQSNGLAKAIFAGQV